VPPSGNMQQPAITNRQVRGLLLFNAWLRSTYVPPVGVKIVDTWSTVAEPIATPADDTNVWCRAGLSIKDASVQAGGSGYGPNTRIDITHNGGQGGGLTPVIVGGVVTSVLGALRGYDYTSGSPPTAVVVDPDGGGSGALITPRLTGGIGSIAINSPGTGVVDGEAISAPQGGALSFAGHIETDGTGIAQRAKVDVMGFGYSSTPAATAVGVTLTATVASPYMWKTPMTTGDTHEVLAGLQAEAALIRPLVT
jgi:hypothetical protein